MRFSSRYIPLLLAVIASVTKALDRNAKDDSSGPNKRKLVVGGEEASRGQFPFAVDYDGCTGSLIHDDIVLTAAHCGPDFATPFQVRIGQTIQGLEVCMLHSRLL